MSGRTRVLVLRKVEPAVHSIVAGLGAAVLSGEFTRERLVDSLRAYRNAASMWKPSAVPALDAAVHLVCTEPSPASFARKWLGLSKGEAVEVEDVDIHFVANKAEAEALVRRLREEES